MATRKGKALIHKPIENWTVEECTTLVDKLNDDLAAVAECDDIMCHERSPYRTDILDIARVMWNAEKIMPMPAPERWVITIGSKVRKLFKQTIPVFLAGFILGVKVGAKAYGKAFLVILSFILMVKGPYWMFPISLLTAGFILYRNVQRGKRA